MNYKKLLLAGSVIAWSGFVVAAYFVVQRPLALQVTDHLMSFVWTFVVIFILLCNALALGTFTVRQFIPDIPNSVSSLALACGIGLGELGLLGFAFAAAGISDALLLFALQLLLLSLLAWKGIVQSAISLLKSSILQIRSSGLLIPSWMRWIAIFGFVLTFLMTLLPPADAFDALLYHLTIPERWIQDGGLSAYNFPHYWFPGLVEGIYFWGLGLGSEIVPQQIHFTYALCLVLLVWDWTQRIWGNLTAWWAIMLILSMPSFLLLASWAYTDMALIFFGIAMLYTLSYGREQANTRWWSISAISAGMAMGVKYTSFVMPLTAVFLISVWKFHEKKDLFMEIIKFSCICAVVALTWYLRNWIWMGNPFYPFVFGGLYWDEFRSAWFAGAGTGSGWDLRALILLPLKITLGYQDINSIDADIGPLLLVAFPITLWVIAKKNHTEDSRRITLHTVGFFTLFSVIFWTYGYINTRNLWQTRLLLPAIIPFLIPSSVGITSLVKLDTRSLRLSFILSSLAALSIFVNLLDIGLTIIARNPLSIATGIVTSQTYYEKYQPEYAYALQAISQTPSDSIVYSLFEPRSYGMTRSIQPDPILDNFSHDIHLYGEPKKIVDAWRLQGYTHVLLNKRAVGLVLNSTEDQAVFDATVALLRRVSSSTSGNFELLEIPIAR